MTTASTTAAYLAMLGLDADLPPTVETLTAVHRAHALAVPYTNLDIMLGRPPSVVPRSCLERLVATGRAGYCFHQNGALGTALLDLGLAVERRHGHVWTRADDRHGTDLNHLVLLVTGLPTDTNPDGRWWPDVGLGEGPLDPVPLVAGATTIDDGPLRFGVEVDGDGWTFRNDPTGSFLGIGISRGACGAREVDATHTTLSAPGTGAYAQKLVAQRRDPDGATTVRGCTLVRVDASGVDRRDLASYDEWRGALDAVGLRVDDVPDAELRALFDRSVASHRAWVEAGRR